VSQKATPETIDIVVTEETNTDLKTKIQRNTKQLAAVTAGIIALGVVAVLAAKKTKKVVEETPEA
jgi:hypothetical protein